MLCYLFYHNIKKKKTTDGRLEERKNEGKICLFSMNNYSHPNYMKPKT